MIDMRLLNLLLVLCPMWEFSKFLGRKLNVNREAVLMVWLVVWSAISTYPVTYGVPAIFGDVAVIAARLVVAIQVPVIWELVIWLMKHIQFAERIEDEKIKVTDDQRARQQAFRVWICEHSAPYRHTINFLEWGRGHNNVIWLAIAAYIWTGIATLNFSYYIIVIMAIIPVWPLIYLYWVIIRQAVLWTHAGRPGYTPPEAIKVEIPINDLPTR